MITVVQAFESAHAALAGTPFHEAVADVVITRDEGRYNVLFTPPGRGSDPADPASANVAIDAESGRVIEARTPDDTARGTAAVAGISVRRALEIAMQRLKETLLNYDPQWTTSVLFEKGRYVVTFPVPADIRALIEAADYALRLTIDVRTGDIVDAVGGG